MTIFAITWKSLVVDIRLRLVCKMSIPLEKWIVITSNKQKWNEIIIFIPYFGNNIYVIEPKLPKKKLVTVK